MKKEKSDEKVEKDKGKEDEPAPKASGIPADAAKLTLASALVMGVLIGVLTGYMVFGSQSGEKIACSNATGIPATGIAADPAALKIEGVLISREKPLV